MGTVKTKIVFILSRAPFCISGEADFHFVCFCFYHLSQNSTYAFELRLVPTPCGLGMTMTLGEGGEGSTTDKIPDRHQV